MLYKLCNVDNISERTPIPLREDSARFSRALFPSFRNPLILRAPTMRSLHETRGLHPTHQESGEWPAIVTDLRHHKTREREGRHGTAVIRVRTRAAEGAEPRPGERARPTADGAEQCTPRATRSRSPGPAPRLREPGRIRGDGSETKRSTRRTPRSGDLRGIAIMGARVHQTMSATSSDSEDAKTRQQCRKLRSSSREAELSSQGGHQQQSPSSPAPACLVGGDDLLPFLDAEQDNLFLFPEEWHGDASTLGMELRPGRTRSRSSAGAT